jgi:hypothetical protein
MLNLEIFVEFSNWGRGKKIPLQFLYGSSIYINMKVFPVDPKLYQKSTKTFDGNTKKYAAIKNPI